MSHTLKQEIALIKTVENGGNVTQAMREAGYAKSTLNNPSNLTGSKGYRELLEEAGLTESLVARALVEDIKGKPMSRINELLLASKLLGLLDKKKQGDGDRNLPIPILHIPYEIAVKNGIRATDCSIENLRQKNDEELEAIINDGG